MDPLVALMRRYVVDYTNRHDTSLCAELMEPDYTLRMGSHVVTGRDDVYVPTAQRQFTQFPGLGLTVHEIVTNGERLAMRFSEHGASVRHDGALASWSGLGLYRWNGRKLTENWVEQDYQARRRQLASGVPDTVAAPAVAPWDTAARPADPSAEQVVREWVAAGLPRAGVQWDDDAAGSPGGAVPRGGDVAGPPGGAVPRGGDVAGRSGGAVRLGGDVAGRSGGAAPRAGDAAGSPGAAHGNGGASDLLEDAAQEVDDLFSAGDRVAVRVTRTGAYAGGLDGVDPSAVGDPATLHLVALVTVSGGEVVGGHGVRNRLDLARSVTGDAR